MDCSQAVGFRGSSVWITEDTEAADDTDALVFIAPNLSVSSAASVYSVIQTDGRPLAQNADTC